MNFLAHFWVTDRAGLPLAGALLGDLLRGPVPESLPVELARSVRLHRRVDVLTDAHPRVLAAKATFPQGARRYAGILLDLLFDHCLARDWDHHGDEPLDRFSRRCGEEVASAREWFERHGHKAPNATLFSTLLQSYASEAGIERAVRRTARRLRNPSGLLDAMSGWRGRLRDLSGDLPVLLADLESQAALNSAFNASMRRSL